MTLTHFTFNVYIFPFQHSSSSLKIVYGNKRYYYYVYKEIAYCLLITQNAIAQIS